MPKPGTPQNPAGREHRRRSPAQRCSDHSQHGLLPRRLGGPQTGGWAHPEDRERFLAGGRELIRHLTLNCWTQGCHSMWWGMLGYSESWAAFSPSDFFNTCRGLFVNTVLSAGRTAAAKFVLTAMVPELDSSYSYKVSLSPCNESFSFRGMARRWARLLQP